MTGKHMHMDAPAHPGPRDALPSPVLPVVGFDVVARAWLAEATRSASLVQLPLLRGHLLVDVAAQIRAIDDDGEPARQLIAAMLIPEGVEDIVRMMRFCDEHGIVVTSPNAGGKVDPGPIVRIHADALGRQRPMLRVVGTD